MMTNPDINTDFRALCAELLQPLAEYDGANLYHEHRDLITRARAALDKPEWEGPSDEVLLRIAASVIEPYESLGIAIGEYEQEAGCSVEVYGSELIAYARAVLARFALAEAPEEMDLEANFRAWYGDVHGSPYFGAMPLCVAIKWAQHLLQQAAPPAPETDDGDVAIDRWIESRPDWPNGWPAVTQSQLTALIGEALEHWGRPATLPAPEVLSAEVKELVAALKEPGDPFPEYRTITSEQADRIATLLQQQESRVAFLRYVLIDCGQAVGGLVNQSCSDSFLLDVATEVRLAIAKPAPAVVPDAGGVIDVLIKAEAILANIVEGESPVNNGPSNAHNYFAEQCGYLESELEKCDDLLSIIRSAIQP